MGLTRRHRLMNRFPSKSVRNPPENTFIRRRFTSQLDTFLKYTNFDQNPGNPQKGCFYRIISHRFPLVFRGKNRDFAKISPKSPFFSKKPHFCHFDYKIYN